jgi:alpha-ketoglutarate-dependent taurine dioxygenase
MPPTRSLGTIRRKAVDLSHFNPVRESLFNDQALPLVLEPAAAQVDLADWALHHRAELGEKLARHGGILFRGFDLKDARDFQRVAAGICTELYADYGDLPRENVAEKVYHSTPYPEDQMILYHNESSHLSSFPCKINFFCVIAAKEGGATPIVDCRKVYQGLDAPLRDQFEQKGLRYVRNFCEGLDVSWQRFFGTEDRSVVEESCRKGGATCEWLSDNHLRVGQSCRAIRKHPVTGEKTFFNQVQLHHVHCLDPKTRESLASIFGPEEMPRSVTFGDGTRIPDEAMDRIGEVYERYAVRFEWKAGDMVSLDNLLTAHARDPYSGPRKIVVALGDMIESASLEARGNGDV